MSLEPEAEVAVCLLKTTCIPQRQGGIIIIIIINYRGDLFWTLTYALPSAKPSTWGT